MTSDLDERRENASQTASIILSLKIRGCEWETADPSTAAVSLRATAAVGMTLSDRTLDAVKRALDVLPRIP
jgi:hypothetical protein